jgi:spore maturation protein CgeB
MHFVIFGLTVSSSWGNGHATLWRALIKAMAERSHTVTFYERDVPYYATARDGWKSPKGARLRLYGSLEEIRSEAAHDLKNCDVAICTSYCVNGAAISKLILDSDATIKMFYDLDTPVTLDALRTGAKVDYLPIEGLGEFDLVLSYTGGRALDELQSRLGAHSVAPLYGSVDLATHYPVAARDEFRATLSYLGTYAADRQKALEELFLGPACRLPQERFLIGGAQYPEHFPWRLNVFFTQHMSPLQHPAFFCSSRATLNITRRAMAEYGYCPSGRLFEAAACGAPLLSDSWEGLETFFTPDEEILRVQTTDDVLQALSLSDKELERMAKAARARVLEEHTAARRVIELESLCERVLGTAPPTALAC